MRILMWFTVGVACSCVFCAYFMTADVLLLLASVCALCAIGGFFLSRYIDKKPLASIALIGAVLGLLWFWLYDGYYLKPISELDGVTTDAVIEIIDYSYSTDYGIAADGVSVWQDKTVRLKLYLDDPTLVLNPGDEVRGTFRFRITDSGGEKEPTYHRGRGITLIAYQSGEIDVHSEVMPLWKYPAAMIRSALLKNIDAIFPEDTGSFAKALLLGDDSGIDYETDTAFKISGIRHIIAVSGLHVSILFSVIYLLSGRNKVLTSVIGIPVLVFFALIAGLTPSVIRACIMHGLMILAMLWDREYDSLTALSFAALVMLICNPLVVTDIGFQLSFACMLGILLFSTNIRQWLLEGDRLGHASDKTIKGKLVRGFAGSLSVSLGSIVFSSPLAALHFGTVSLAGVLTNLLTLWIVTISFYGVMFAALIGLVWTVGGAGIAWLISWPMRFIIYTAKLIASFPLAAVYLRSNYILVWMIVCYILLAVLLCSRKKRPALFGGIAVLGLCIALILSWLPAQRDVCRVTVLDVGQGQSILLQSKGYTFIVDCGGDYDDTAADTAAETLLSQGINRIDGLIVTHYDADHAGGIDELLTRIKVDNLFLPAYQPETEISNALLAYKEGNVYQVDESLVIPAGEAKLTVLTSLATEGDNESSLCILFQAGNCDILITGDRTGIGEKLLLKQISLPKVEFLIAGHHGAKNATCQELLDAVQPQVAVISAGKSNRYGHPHETVLQRLEACGALILRTDQDGTIIFRGMTHGEENRTTE